MRRFRVVQKDDERVIGEGCVLSDGRTVVVATRIQMNPILYETEARMADDWGTGCSIEYLDGAEVVT